MASPLVTKPCLRRMDFPACTANACGQDSRRCRTPQACHVPADDFDPSKPNVLASAFKYGLMVFAFGVIAFAPVIARWLQ